MLENDGVGVRLEILNSSFELPPNVTKRISNFKPDPNPVIFQHF